MTQRRRDLILHLSALQIWFWVSGCSQTPPAQTQTAAPANTPGTAVARKTPVIAERPARMYIWAGFDPKDCKAVTPKLTVTQQPSKGAVSFQPNQLTTITQSSSGACLGRSLRGTGIYYTAHKGQSGADQFSVTATAGSRQAVSRTFQLNIEN